MASGVNGAHTHLVLKHVEQDKNQGLEHAPILLHQVAEVAVRELLWRIRRAI